MAKWEIHKRLGIWEALWWRFVPGKEVVVKWPVGKVVIDDTMPEYDCHKPLLIRKCDLPNQGKLQIPLSTAWETEHRVRIVTGKQLS